MKVAEFMHSAGAPFPRDMYSSEKSNEVVGFSTMLVDGKEKYEGEVEEELGFRSELKTCVTVVHYEKI